MPKEMLPIIDKPTIQYIVEEAVNSGIEDIIIVTGKGKRAIEDHFDSAPELEFILRERGESELLEKVVHPSKLANIHYIRQAEPKGLGHAIWVARKFIGNEPFGVLLGDDIVKSQKPCLKQLIEQYNTKLSSIVGVQKVPYSETERYGIIEPENKIENLYKVSNFIEKPKIGTTSSNLAIMGRYILTPDIFPLLEKTHVGAGDEIQLTDAIQELNTTSSVYAYEFEGHRYDVGEKLGFVKTTIEFALQDAEIKEDIREMLKKVSDEM